jgi:vacuolar-type H+-ATPase subunit E/Vma4
MAITDISNKIIDDAKKTAEWISEDTEKELKKIERETKKKIKDLGSEYEKKTTRMLQEQARMIESAAEHGSRLLINRKKEIY